MSRNDTWMPLYVGDYLRDTGHLTDAQHGQYLLLLMQAWVRGGVLPNDDRQLRSMANASPHGWKNSRNVVLNFFYLSDEGYRHKRIEKELESARVQKAQKSEAGRASANKRWGDIVVTSVTPPLPSRCNGTSNGSATEELRKSNPSPSPSEVEDLSSSSLSKEEAARGPVRPTLDQLVAEGPAKDVIAILAKEIKRPAYAPGRNCASIDDQVAAVTNPSRPKEYPLTPEQLLIANPARRKHA